VADQSCEIHRKFDVIAVYSKEHPSVSGATFSHSAPVSENVGLMRHEIGLTRPRLRYLCQIARLDRFSGCSTSAGNCMRRWD
jgi:hypothetical protein